MKIMELSFYSEIEPVDEYRCMDGVLFQNIESDLFEKQSPLQTEKEGKKI